MAEQQRGPLHGEKESEIKRMEREKKTEESREMNPLGEYYGWIVRAAILGRARPSVKASPR
jgi:hypothetical protein